MYQYIRFEWRYFVRQPSFYVTSLIFFLMAFFASASNNIGFGGGDFWKNSAYSVSQMLVIFNLIAIFLVVNFVGSAAVRNAAFNMEQLIYTKPLAPLQYQLGRFIGAFLVVAAVFLWVPVGHILGSFMWWVDAERFGPLQLANYAMPYLCLSLPTLLVLSALFYAVALKFRSMMALYLVAVALFIGYSVSGGLMNRQELRALAALLDPFGINTLNELTRYWTSAEKNTNPIALTGTLLHNRLLWLAIGLSAIALLINRKKMPTVSSDAVKAAPEKELPVYIPTALATVVPAPSHWLQFKTRTLFECKQVFLSAPFIVLAVFTLIQFLLPLINGAWTGWAIMNLLPVTHKMVSHIIGAASLFFIIILVYYTAEIVWRERALGIGDVVDSQPVHNLTLWSSKLVALLLVIVTLFLVGMLVAIGFQLSKGYTHIELAQYAIRLGYFTLVSWVMMAILAFLLQVISPNKYVGMLLFVAYFLTSMVLESWGFSHSMFQFSGAPALIYSDMNGYGWALKTHAWYMLYWGGLSLVLFVLGYGLFHRGPQQPLIQRLRMLGHHLGGAGKLAIALGLGIFISAGAYIFYSTRVLNEYQTSDQHMDQQSDYEKQYRQFAADPMLTATSVNAQVDIFPAERRINARFAIQYQNQSDRPISQLLVNLPEHTPLASVQLDFPHATLELVDAKRRLGWLKFSTPVAVGERIYGRISLSRENLGIRDGGDDVRLVENGTFIDYWSLLPEFGYQERYELRDKHERRKHNLPVRAQGNKLDDSSHYGESDFGRDKSFIDFEATLSTSDDQIALAPGYLQREWKENNRRYFHYKMDSPMFNFYSFLSARLAVKQENYKGVDLAVYYHPEHLFNIDKMQESLRDSLDYCNAAFGPYQFHQLRVIEFPQYGNFAQSFPNTVPYSEGMGFIADLNDKEKVDMVYYITAHEVAHQWWGHQTGAANVRGSSALSETLAQYTALNIMAKKYGAEKMRVFLRHELDDYLSGRANEALEELPLAETFDQAYVHYNKGSIVMFAIADRIGEQKLNANLRAYVDRFKYQANPYPTTIDLLAFIKQGTTADEQKFIDDLFTKITLYDFVVDKVVVDDLPDGQFKISLDVSAKQIVATGKGVEAEQPMSELVDIGMFSSDPDKLGSEKGTLYLHKHRLQSGSNHLELVTSQKPVFVGVDPFVKMIDRDAANNIKRL